MVSEIISIAKSAGSILMKYHSKELEIKTKLNEFDFVTQADIESDEYIRKKLNELFPNDLILSEESNNIPTNFTGNVWMVDPLDGTKEFINGGSGFSVLIGLCINGIPTLGVVYVPARNILYYAEKGKGSFMEFENKISKLNVNNISKINQSKIVTRQNRGEKRDMDQLVDSLLTIEQILESSGGVKLGLITEKKAEIHINTHFGVSKWDTCAPQIILEEAGGKITDFEGKELDYKQKSLNWEKSYVATNSIIHDEVIEHIKDYLNNN